MKLAKILLTTAAVAAIAGLILCSSTALATSAEDANAQGKNLLSKGDFKGALKSFATAARADRDNQEYLRNFSMLRQVVALRSRLDKEQDPERWEYIARALQAYYTTEQIYPAALALGEKIHAKLNTADSAEALAETQLAMGKNVEAEKMLAKLDPKKATLSTKSLHGLALVRLDKADKAEKIALGLAVPKDAGPREIYCAARLQAAVGNVSEAVKLLATCMENVRPSLQDGYRAHAKQCDEFASLSSTDEFAKALATKSKVPESACSGGSKCAGCPNRANCSKAAKE
ncbi:MAG: hypothetical protein JXM70_10800 [Pirellulales bacterium]|nr:hypothetical protein [Pirellulales bacterium]